MSDKLRLFKLLLPAAFALLVVSCSNDPQTRKAGSGSPADGSVLSFSLPDLQGKRTDLTSLGKKLVLVDFWTTWCPPCRESIPHLNAFSEAHRERIAVVGISLDTKPAADVAAFSRAMEIKYPVLTGGRDLAVQYRITSIPTIFVTDGSGKILRRHTGMADARTLQDLVKGL